MRNYCLESFYREVYAKEIELEEKIYCKILKGCPKYKQKLDKSRNLFKFVSVLLRDEQWLSRKSRSQGSPPIFLSLDTSLNIKTVISKNLDSSLDIKTQDFRVSIPVSISRLKFQKSWFQSRYKDSTIKSLDFSLDVQT